MLATPAAEPFDSPAHIFEVLWDGVRAIAYVESGAVRLQDRFGRDITHRYPELGAISGRVRESGVAIDGAIVALDDEGRPDFHRLRPRLAIDDRGAARDLATETPVTFHAFDLLYREGRPITGWPLRRRKETLGGIVRQDAAIAVPDGVARDGVAFFEAAREHELEGIVAKELESRYLPGERSRSWLTVRVYRKDEFVVAGYTYGGRWNERDPRKPPREPFSSLLLGQFGNDGRLRYVGEVTGGFQDHDMDDLMRNLDDLATTASPFAEQPELGRLVFWCRPELAATVRYAEMTPDCRLRFAVFEALRPDIPAHTCRDEGD